MTHDLVEESANEGPRLNEGRSSVDEGGDVVEDSDIEAEAGSVATRRASPVSASSGSVDGKEKHEKAAVRLSWYRHVIPWLRPQPSEDDGEGKSKRLRGRKGPPSDLTLEDLEELRMITSFNNSDMHRYRSMFLGCVEDPARITKEEFLNLPSIAINPLKERLLACFSFGEEEESLTFRGFMEAVSVFNNPLTSGDLKLRAAFNLHDFDGDGEISRNDLVKYLSATLAVPSGTSLDIDQVAQRILDEAASPPYTSISLADFQRVMAPSQAEWVGRLAIPLL
ncbi:unnamed protein product [Chrysoparadoxa australica]